MNIFFSRNGGIVLSLSRILPKRFVASKAKEQTDKDEIDITKLEEQPVIQENIAGFSEEEIEQKRNKSRLGAGDRSILHNTIPCNEIIHRYQTTVKYKRRMFGRYGMEASDFPIGIAWPTKEEVEDLKEYESVLYPDTIQQSWDKIAKRKAEEAESIRTRDETIAKNLLKLDKWTADLNARIAKKETDALEARLRKERLIEEVRRHFGFKISPKDERFKEMLAQKDKADKKMKKAARKEARVQKMMALLEGKGTTNSNTDKTEATADS